MKLYHFTSVSLAKAVLSDSLSQGHLDLHTGQIIKGVVWFTSLPFPKGTGVPTESKRISAKQAEKAVRLQGELRNDLTSDKSKIRFSVDARSLSDFKMVDGRPYGLISFDKWCRLVEAPKHWVKYMGLSAMHDIDGLSDDELRRLLKKKDSSKEHTWYLHFGPVQSSLIEAVDFKLGGNYISYDFERHGLEAMSELGIECVAGVAHTQLLEIVKPGHRQEIVHAGVICTDPLKDRNVCIRGLGNSCVLNIDSKRVVTLHKDDSNYPIKAVESWAEGNVHELIRCWEGAVESFYRFFPEKRIIEK
ncbi:hypothetical protein [Pseudomonas sp. CC120222-01a]|uniref:hypothetical protein n=1 Tax=Pseudomonas sp. CC120222-01a TaxID=1378075 RepID=UPI000DA0C929|nr:hypothetical protein [Pseudomonas sp. CC120222-01a]PVZ37342.1 hypothetical protein N430_04365 [Pseudomonas sp. CC120222-01a]